MPLCHGTSFILYSIRNFGSISINSATTRQAWRLLFDYLWCIIYSIREYIRSEAGVKQLFHATNNNAPRQPITLNLIHLITHDYNPQNIPKLKCILPSDPSHLCCSLPLIKTQRRSARAFLTKAFKFWWKGESNRDERDQREEYT